MTEYCGDTLSKMPRISNKKAKNELVLSPQGYPVVQTISMDLLPRKESMVEITDSVTLAHLNHLFPEMFKTAVSTKNAIQAGSKTLYEVIIPKGYSLAESKAMKGAYRGFFHGKKGIEGHANILKFNQKGNQLALAASSMMSVTSMVVGQYYMAQINAKMDLISENVSKVSHFLEDEYRGKLQALISQIKSITTFKSEILENEKLLSTEFNRMYQMEEKCMEMLGHANEGIFRSTQKQKLDFKAYNKELNQIHSWYVYQQVLFDLLEQIANIKYALSLGSASRDYCFALYKDYSNQVSMTNSALIKWHETNIKRLGINIETSKRFRPILIAAIFYKLRVRNFNYMPMTEETVEKILTQTRVISKKKNDVVMDLYHEDVRILSKDGKVFYIVDDDKK